MEPPSRVSVERRYRLADGGLILLPALAAFALGCQELFDADVWWHVRAGQWILANGRVPRLDLFTFGSVDRPWIDLHWLFELVLATVFAVGRVPAIVLLTAVVSAAVLMVAPTARDKRWPSWVVAACWLPALVAMSARFLPRPELFSLLAVAVYLTVLRRGETTPKLAWILVPVQVFWVNVHAFFALGPFLLSAYLIDGFIRSVGSPARAADHATAGSNRTWWCHVGGATVAVGLASLANPYGLQGLVFPLELLPKITAWGGTYKSYIAEFMDLRDYIRNQGIQAAAGNPFVRADCFLLWLLPVGAVIPGVWRNGRPADSRVVGFAAAVGWLLGLAAACWIDPPLTSVLVLPGRSCARRGAARSAELAPLGFFALGALGAVLAVRTSRRAVLLALFGGAVETAWILWLRLHLFGRMPGLPTWLSDSGSPVLGAVALVLGVVTVGLLLTAGERPFRIILALVFGYLALQAVRNAGLLGLVAGFVLSWSLGEWVADLLAQVPVQTRRRWSFTMARLAVRVTVAALIGGLMVSVVSGPYFPSTGERRRFGIVESPLAYAHGAARFAGRPGLPEKALVFSLAQAGVYLFHNSPDRKPFMDGRLEVPSRATFETYVRLNEQLQRGGPEWKDVLRRMGDPLVLLDHERNFGG